MADNNEKEPQLSLDEQAMLKVAIEANLLERGESRDVVIDGKTWKIRPTSMSQNQKMLNLDYDILSWQRELKKEDLKPSKVRKLSTKIRKAYAKKAAYKIVGYRLCYIPFYYAWMWRKIYRSKESISATLNTEEAIGSNKDFYLANLGSSKRALVLSTMQVGNADKQKQERMASAQAMLDEDALPKKKEDSK